MSNHAPRIPGQVGQWPTVAAQRQHFLASSQNVVELSDGPHLNHGHVADPRNQIHVKRGTEIDGVRSDGDVGRRRHMVSVREMEEMTVFLRSNTRQQVSHGAGPWMQVASHM